MTTYEIKIPMSGWIQEPIPGGDITRKLGCPRATAEVEVSPWGDQRRWLAVSLVQVGEQVEIEDECVYAIDPESGAKIELGAPPASWTIRLVR